MLLHDRIVLLARKNEGVNEGRGTTKGGRGRRRHGRDARRVEGCVWVLSISLISLSCVWKRISVTRVNVYSMYRRTIDALYFRYGEKYTGRIKLGRERGEKKSTRHSIRISCF